MRKKEAIGYGLLFVVLCVFGYLFYIQSNNLPNQETGQVVLKNKADKSNAGLSDSGFSNLNRDELLDELFPTLLFKSGKATADILGVSVTLSLKDSKEDYFVTGNEKNLLLIVELEGMPHAGGLYHAYLGLFNNRGDLLTSPIKLTDTDWNKSTEGAGHFGGDEGGFGFYSCGGIDYILSITGSCANGSCCDDSARLYRINKGKFESVADGINIDEYEKKSPWKITALADKLVIKTVPETSENDCQESDYKELKWSKTSCRFE